MGENEGNCNTNQITLNHHPAMQYTGFQGGNKKSGRRGSNSRQLPWQGSALPTELLPHSFLNIDLNPIVSSQFFVGVSPIFLHMTCLSYETTKHPSHGNHSFPKTNRVLINLEIYTDTVFFISAFSYISSYLAADLSQEKSCSIPRFTSLSQTSLFL